MTADVVIPLAFIGVILTPLAAVVGALIVGEIRDRWSR